MSELKFSPIDEIIADLKAGKLVIVADDPGRENEADLVGAASLISPESIAFMANYGRGLICTPIIPERAKALDLSPMTPKNREAHKTAFTISIDAAEGITTGISAADRAHTLNVLANPESTAASVIRPGHVLPLRAVDGGVSSTLRGLPRSGKTP